MKALRLLRLLSGLLSASLGGTAAATVPLPPRPAAADAAPLLLTPAQVYADAPQPLAGPGHWRYRPGAPAGWAAPAGGGLAITAFLLVILLSQRLRSVAGKVLAR